MLQSEWKNIVGAMVANHTERIVLKDKKLILKIDSAPLRNELLMSKKLLIENVNTHLGQTVIYDIVFV